MQGARKKDGNENEQGVPDGVRQYIRKRLVRINEDDAEKKTDKREIGHGPGQVPFRDLLLPVHGNYRKKLDRMNKIFDHRLPLIATKAQRKQFKSQISKCKIVVWPRAILYIPSF